MCRSLCVGCEALEKFGTYIFSLTTQRECGVVPSGRADKLHSIISLLSVVGTEIDITAIIVTGVQYRSYSFQQ